VIVLNKPPDVARSHPGAIENEPVEAVKLEVGGLPFLFPRSIEERVAEVMRGKYHYGVLPDPPKVRRIVDITAGVGDFACWAWRQWPNAWIECYEPDPVLRKFLELNLPPGAAVHSVDAKELGVAGDLPPCDVLRLDAGGGEADILRGYRHVPSIVCFQWNRDTDRLDIERILSSWGLRCFRISFKNVDVGHEVWVRSRAVWNYAKKGYEVP
jgi:hypothetical protein